MKNLHLIRHAKSSWADGSLSDHQRPLNQRGINSCQIMAPQIIEANCIFEHVFCSTAVRAQSTIENINQHLPDLDISWQLDDRLYTFDYRAVFDWCRELDNSLSDVVIIGHNPAMTELCNELSHSNIDNLPTCSYVQLAINCDAWQELSAGSAKLLHFLAPKMFMSK